MPDQTIWRHALEHHLTIVSKDNDFRQRAAIEGPPPKVIWLAIGNARTNVIELLLRQHHETIARFADNDFESLLVIEPR